MAARTPATAPISFAISSKRADADVRRESREKTAAVVPPKTMKLPKIAI
jgi:hypothetical protein